MPEEISFTALLQQIRQGNQDAAAELIRRYEQQLRIITRVKLRSNSLRQIIDTMDICQSVLGGFFEGAKAGKFELQSPQDVMNLLAVMVRNKIIDIDRRQRAECRDIKRRVNAPLEELSLSAPGETPSEIVAQAEMLDEVSRRLTREERETWLRKQAGATWNEIAAETGMSPEAAQKKYSRAMARVVEELKLDEQ